MAKLFSDGTYSSEDVEIYNYVRVNGEEPKSSSESIETKENSEVDSSEVVNPSEVNDKAKIDSEVEPKNGFEDFNLEGDVQQEEVKDYDKELNSFLIEMLKNNAKNINNSFELQFEPAKLNSLYEYIRLNSNISTALTSIEDFKKLLVDIVNDRKVTFRGDSFLLDGHSVKPQDLINKVLIQFVPIDKLSENAKRIAIENRPLYCIAQSDWSCDLFNLIHKCIKIKFKESRSSKISDISSPEDLLMLSNVLSGFQNDRRVYKYFEGRDLEDLSKFILKISNDEKAKVWEQEIRFDGQHVSLNKLFDKVILQFIPEPELNLSESALQTLSTESTLVSADLVDDVVTDIATAAKSIANVFSSVLRR